jgi:magnesium transporter
VTLIGGLLAGSVIGLFEGVLNSVVFLIIFVPVIMAMGGNVAMQSSTVFVRGLATGEIERPMMYFLREIKIGFMMGCLIGLGTAIAAQLWKGMPILGAIAGTAMFFTVILATANGVLVPKLFDRLGIDPAISASPFVTTIQDILGLVIYFSLATVMLLYIT